MDHIWTYRAPLFNTPIQICTIPDQAPSYFPPEMDWGSGWKGTCVEWVRPDGFFELWIVLDSLELETCCHESVHAAIAVLNRVGTGFNYEEQEPLAYLTAAIFGFTRDAVFKHYERLGKKA